MEAYGKGVTTPLLFGRQTMYAGIAMRSRTEARYAQWLDESGSRWHYEPRCYAGPTGQYLPDFQRIHESADGSLHDIFTEVKAGVPAGLDALKARMEIIWLSEPDATLEIVVVGRDALEHQWLAALSLGWQRFDLRARVL